MDSSTTLAFLSQKQFDAMSGQWLSLLEAGNDALQSAFKTANGLATYASFQAEDIVRLVSAVGVASIKARFVVLPNASASTFGIVLFGTDADGQRLTPYLAAPAVAGPSRAIGAVEMGAAAVSPVAMVVPDSIVATWLGNWAMYGSLDNKPFAYQNDFLRGYTFKAAEFIDTLFATADTKGAELQVWFGLHQAYTVDAQSAADLRSTFGLAVCLTTAASKDQIYYDFSMPCPPTC